MDLWTCVTVNVLLGVPTGFFLARQFGRGRSR